MPQWPPLPGAGLGQPGFRVRAIGPCFRLGPYRGYATQPAGENRGDARSALLAVDGIVEVQSSWPSPSKAVPAHSPRTGRRSANLPERKGSRSGSVIRVSSGKGRGGKRQTVADETWACALRRQGLRVGLLDAGDIYGTKRSCICSGGPIDPLRCAASADSRFLTPI